MDRGLMLRCVAFCCDLLELNLDSLRRVLCVLLADV